MVKLKLAVYDRDYLPLSRTAREVVVGRITAQLGSFCHLRYVIGRTLGDCFYVRQAAELVYHVFGYLAGEAVEQRVIAVFHSETGVYLAYPALYVFLRAFQSLCQFLCSVCHKEPSAQLFRLGDRKQSLARHFYDDVNELGAFFLRGDDRIIGCYRRSLCRNGHKRRVSRQVRAA